MEGEMIVENKGDSLIARDKDEKDKEFVLMITVDNYMTGFEIVKTKLMTGKSERDVMRQHLEQRAKKLKEQEPDDPECWMDVDRTMKEEVEKVPGGLLLGENEYYTIVARLGTQTARKQV